MPYDMAHLKPTEQQKLAELLNKYPHLFKGGLGTLNVPPVKIEIRPLTQSEEPYHARAFPIPHCYKETTRKEMKRLEEIGVFKHANDSEWAGPTLACGSKENRRRCAHPD